MTTNHIDISHSYLTKLTNRKVWCEVCYRHRDTRKLVQSNLAVRGVALVNADKEPWILTQVHKGSIDKHNSSESHHKLFREKWRDITYDYDSGGKYREQKSKEKNPTPATINVSNSNSNSSLQSPPAARKQASLRESLQPTIDKK